MTTNIQRYTIKYELIDDNTNKSTKLTVFNDLESLLGFMINISFLCEEDAKMTVYNKETKEKIIEDYPCNILQHFKPEMSEEELYKYFWSKMLKKTLDLID